MIMNKEILVENLKKTLKAGAGILLALTLAACGNKGNAVQPAAAPERVDTGFVLTNAKSYDSADTAVIVKIKEDDGTITFLNLDTGRKYTLSYDGTSSITDKYGSALVCGAYIFRI